MRRNLIIAAIAIALSAAIYCIFIGCNDLLPCEDDSCNFDPEGYNFDSLKMAYYLPYEIVFSMSNKPIELGPGPKEPIPGPSKPIPGPKEPINVPFPIASTNTDLNLNSLIVNFYHSLGIELEDSLILENIEIDTCICGENIFLFRDSTLTIEMETKVAENENNSNGKDGGIFSLNYVINSNEVAMPSKLKNIISPRDMPSIKLNSQSDTSIARIAFLDTGIAPLWIENGTVIDSVIHPEYCDSLVRGYGWNFYDLNSNVSDDNSHGTMVHLAYNTALLKTCNDTIVPPQKLMFVKTLNECGFGTSYSNACGIHYARVNNMKYINCSWGYDFLDAQIERAAYEAVDAGIIIITSAGNNGDHLNNTDSLHFPSGWAFDYPDSFGFAQTFVKENVFEITGLHFSPTYDPLLDYTTADYLRWEYSNYRSGFNYAEPATNFQTLEELSNSLDCSINGTSFAAPSFLGGAIRLDFLHSTFDISDLTQNTTEFEQDYWSLSFLSCLPSSPLQIVNDVNEM